MLRVEYFTLDLNMREQWAPCSQPPFPDRQEPIGFVWTAKIGHPLLVATTIYILLLFFFFTHRCCFDCLEISCGWWLLDPGQSMSIFMDIGNPFLRWMWLSVFPFSNWKLNKIHKLWIELEYFVKPIAYNSANYSDWKSIEGCKHYFWKMFWWQKT